MSGSATSGRVFRNAIIPVGSPVAINANLELRTAARGVRIDIRELAVRLHLPHDFGRIFLQFLAIRSAQAQVELGILEGTGAEELHLLNGRTNVRVVFQDLSGVIHGIALVEIALAEVGHAAIDRHLCDIPLPLGRAAIGGTDCGEDIGNAADRLEVSRMPRVTAAPDSGTARADEGFWPVLPFRYTGSNEELKAFTEGLMEEVITGYRGFPICA